MFIGPVESAAAAPDVHDAPAASLHPFGKSLCDPLLDKIVTAVNLGKAAKLFLVLHIDFQFGYNSALIIPKLAIGFAETHSALFLASLYKQIGIHEGFNQMTTVLFVTQIVLTLILTVLVLLQKSSSIGLGAYSGSNESVFGAKGPAGFLVKATFTVGLLFVFNTIALGYLYNKSHNESVVDTIKTESAVPAAPALPSAPSAPSAPAAPQAPAEQ